MRANNYLSHGVGVLSILISLAIAAILIIVVITVLIGGRNDEVGVSKPIERAKNVQCLSNIHAIEIAIKMHQAENGQYPASLNDLKNPGSVSFICPVNSAAYIYESRTGTVRCPDHSR